MVQCQRTAIEIEVGTQRLHTCLSVTDTHTCACGEEQGHSRRFGSCCFHWLSSPNPGFPTLQVPTSPETL